MSYRHTFEAALESLQDIEELVKGFPENGDVPSIELDLTLQKLRNIYELLLVLKRPAEPVAVPEPVDASEPVAAPGPVKVTDPIPVPAPKPVVEAKKPVAVHKESDEAQILSDRYKGRATLHETFHQAIGKDGVTLSQGKPVENLFSAIGINDRFTFIRELFNHDSTAFEHAIQALNEATNFNDAYNFMIQNFDWDMDSDAVQLLLEIIRRKYITSRNE